MTESRFNFSTLVLMSKIGSDWDDDRSHSLEVDTTFVRGLVSLGEQVTQEVLRIYEEVTSTKPESIEDVTRYIETQRGETPESQSYFLSSAYVFLQELSDWINDVCEEES